MPININHIVISEKNKLSALYTDGILKELKTYHSKYHVGDIYIGKLESGLTNINAAFIRLDPNEKNGFIQISNLLPVKTRKQNYIQIENLKFNESILVQITKEPTGNKGPSLSTNIGLNGKYFILLPFGEGINISKKIYNSIEKDYLKAFTSLLKPLEVGVLVKKEASGIPEVVLKNDLQALLDQWYKIQSHLTAFSKPHRVSGRVDLIENSLKAFYTNKIQKISIDSYIGSWRIYKILRSEQPKTDHSKLKIIYYPNSNEFIKSLNLDFSIYTLLQPQLDLSTGGSIVIQKTEALTAIDINSGSFNHIKNSRATLLWINCEAATAITKQLKLRNIGGIIVIDFIDMTHQKDQMKLLNHLHTVLQTDKSYTKIIQLSEIGLIELTRKREGQNIYDVFSHKCHKCNGLGYKASFGSTNTFRKRVKIYETYQNYMTDCGKK